MLSCCDTTPDTLPACRQPGTFTQVNHNKQQIHDWTVAWQQITRALPGLQAAVMGECGVELSMRRVETLLHQELLT